MKRVDETDEPKLGTSDAAPAIPQRSVASVAPATAFEMPQADSPQVMQATLGQPGGVRLHQGMALGPVVLDLPLSIQKGFRVKMLVILIIQLIFTISLAVFFRAITTVEPEPTILAILFPPRSLQTLMLGMLAVVLLPCITWVRERYPWNMVATAAWSVLWAVFMAVAQLPNALVRSNVLFVIFCSTLVGVIFLTLICTMKRRDPETGEIDLVSFNSAGSWSCTLQPPPATRWLPCSQPAPPLAAP